MPTTARFAARLAPVAVLGALAIAAPAQADQPLEASVHRVEESRSETLRFWSDARMRNARPAAMPAAPAALPRVEQAPDGTGRPRAAAKVASASARPRAAAKRRPPAPVRTGGTARASWVGLELPWSNISQGYTTPMQAVGRLFYRTPAGGNSFCSASVVATNVIITAAHCIQNGANGAYNNTFSFVPAVNGTSRPYGSFAARSISVWNGWASPSYRCTAGTGCHGYQAMDYAFITLQPNAAGYNVGQYTGAFGLWPNAPSGNIYLLGYPGEGSWASRQNTPYHCQAPIQRYSRYVEDRYDVGLSCYNTGGSSGGPWFLRGSNGVMYIASVMSHMGKVYFQNPSCGLNCGRYGYTFFGPYLNAETTQLLAIARSR
jgi:V8-like Glu-specific endopeptidase